MPVNQQQFDGVYFRVRDIHPNATVQESEPKNGRKTCIICVGPKVVYKDEVEEVRSIIAARASLKRGLGK